MFKMYNNYKFNLDRDCYENIKNNNYFTILETGSNIYQIVFYDSRNNKLLEKEVEIKDDFDEELKKIISEVEED